MRRKVLIIQDVIPHYRVPVFNELAKHVDLTVVYSDGKTPEDTDFLPVRLEQTKVLKLFRYHKKSYSMVKDFDAVITLLDGSCFTTKLLCNTGKRKKTILWGIGVAAGYNTRYDGCPKTAQVVKKMIQKVAAAVFYSSYPVEKYSQMGIPAEKLFVANNTVPVLPAEECARDTILFIGTLYRAKKIFELLENYKNAYEKDQNLYKLVIVGDGEEYDAVCEWIKENGLMEKIQLTGAIFDDEILKTYFAKAIMCVSPDQAGLSVLKSMGYGVPFVSHKDAITGGERFNIDNGVNGVLFDDFSCIEEIFLDSVKNKEKYLQMGVNAKEHYFNNRTIPQMVDGFVQAVEYCCSKRRK